MIFFFLFLRQGRSLPEPEIKHEEDKFDSNKFIDTLEKQYRTPSPPNTLQCPLYPQYSLEKRESHTEYGHWEYYKCPFQDCFVCCGVDNIDYYLQSARHQIDPYYTRIPLNKMKCYCDRNLYMSMSHLDRNPSRLFLKCPKRYCDFFQWVDTPPHGKSRAHLESPSREGYPRPKNLLQPLPRVDEPRNKRSRESAEKERKYSEKLRNGTFQKRTRTHLPRRVEKKWGMVNDSMEMRRWGLDPPLGPFKGNWSPEFTPKE